MGKYENVLLSIPQLLCKYTSTLLWFLKLGEDVSSFFPSFFLAVILWTSQVVSYPRFLYSFLGCDLWIQRDVLRLVLKTRGASLWIKKEVRLVLREFVQMCSVEVVTREGSCRMVSVIKGEEIPYTVIMVCWRFTMHGDMWKTLRHLTRKKLAKACLPCISWTWTVELLFCLTCLSYEKCCPLEA